MLSEDTVAMMDSKHIASDKPKTRTVLKEEEKDLDL